MKNLMILFIVGLFIACSATRGSQNSLNNIDMASLYKIKKIKEGESFSMIYAVRNDSTFKIISLSDTIRPILKSLEIGKKYQLDLIRIYPNAVVEKPVDDAKIGAIDSCFMSIEKKSHNSLYYATNLNGLSLSETNKDMMAAMNKFSIFTIFCDACKNKFLLRLYLK